MDTDKAAAAVADLLTALDVDEGDHTRDTPHRVARYWAEALTGYHEDPGTHLQRTFTAPDDPGLVMVTGIRVNSTCAHHLLPITGHATVAYRPRPGDRVVGLSKLARVVTGYAKRLQVQEQLGYQITHALNEHLTPLGGGCVITAEHGCMTLRGLAQPGTTTTTHAWIGDWSANHPDAHAVVTEHHQR